MGDATPFWSDLNRREQERPHGNEKKHKEFLRGLTEKSVGLFVFPEKKGGNSMSQYDNAKLRVCLEFAVQSAGRDLSFQELEDKSREISRVL